MAKKNKEKNKKGDSNINNILGPGPWTSKKVEQARYLITQEGYRLYGSNNPFDSDDPLCNRRRKGIKLQLTPEEVEQFALAYDSISYFAENYCIVKSEDGSKKQIKLRDYQKGLFQTFQNNRKVVVMASRQVGKCVHPATEVEVKGEKRAMYQLWPRDSFLDKVRYFIWQQLEYWNKFCFE